MIYFYLLIFSVSVLGIAVIFVRKIPLVLDTPRDMVNDYFLRSSQRLSVRALRLRAWFREGAYLGPTLAFLLRIVKHLRTWLLYLDRYLFQLAHTVNKKADMRKTTTNQENDPHYWDGIRSKYVSPKDEDQSDKSRVPPQADGV